MHQRTQALRALMKAKRLSCAQIGALVGRKETTVRIWRCNDDRKVIPAPLLELIQLKTQQQGTGKAA